MNRESGIDFLKCIGLTGIVLAHINAPGWVMMARSFDVPLMILLSRILARQSYKRFSIEGSFRGYYFHRIKRLVIPTWIFLIIYFSVCFILGDPYRELSYYLYSFGLTRYGVGYVWIVLIYLYGMLLIPLIDNHKPSAKIMLLIAVLYVLFESMYYLKLGTEIKLIDSTFYYIIPYGILTYIGYYYEDITKKAKYAITIISSITFILLAMHYWNVYSEFQLVSIAKYPPRLYFLSFGLACSCTLLLLFEDTQFKLCNNNYICFIGSHTLWIYLWHILALKLYSAFHLPEVWYLKFAIVYSGSIIFTFLINEVLDVLEKKQQKVLFLKYFRG